MLSWEWSGVDVASVCQQYGSHDAGDNAGFSFHKHLSASVLPTSSLRIMDSTICNAWWIVRRYHWTEKFQDMHSSQMVAATVFWPALKLKDVIHHPQSHQRCPSVELSSHRHHLRPLPHHPQGSAEEHKRVGVPSVMPYTIHFMTHPLENHRTTICRRLQLPRQSDW